MTEKVCAILMLEILGKPAGYIKKTLSEIIKKLGQEKDVKITGKKIAEPKNVPEQEALYTSFAEITLETSLEKLIAVCFGYMPSHIEIVSPESLKINNWNMTMLLNELVKRLHQYDELAKGMMIERQILAKRIQEGIKEGKIKIKKSGKKNN